MEIDNVLRNHLTELTNNYSQPQNHVNYLHRLKAEGFEPKVIYDIGSCALHWTKVAREIWPSAIFVLFEASSEMEFLYSEYKETYHIGCLSDEDDKIVKFYENPYYPGGNSYYREIGSANCDFFFPKDKYLEKRTMKLDNVVKERGFLLPDFVKIDVQGAEIDIIRGGINTLKHAKRMIVELQHKEYNEGALNNNIAQPLIESLLNFKCVDPLFQNNGPDGDYGFINKSMK
jgi:FkbM family methyltransferase